MKKKLNLLLLFTAYYCGVFAQDPNFLLIIADDLGVDYFNGYHQSALMPVTPTLDSIRDSGVLFEQAWGTPVCTASRAAIMSGKHGIKTGVQRAPGHLNLSDTSIFSQLKQRLPGKYAGACVGKWHISNPADANHPGDHNVDYYVGALNSGLDDYYKWLLTSGGVTDTSYEYATKLFTDSAAAWINKQSKPWLMWLAHTTPHSPLHVPPAGTYSISGTSANKRKYVAMIENLDHEIKRLLNAMSPTDRDNTMIIFVGDNGTPGNYAQNYPSGQAKGTLYEGGIRVPMLVSGKGVSRKGVREPAMVNFTDIYATILELAGHDLDGGIYNSLSFKHLLDGTAGPTRDYNYSEIESDVKGWTIRNQQYKLIEFDDGSQAFFDLISDSLETTNLIDSLDAGQLLVKADLEAEAAQRRNSWSCKDHIKNGDEQGIDCGGSHCAACITSNNEVTSSSASVQIVGDELHVVHSSNFSISISSANGRNLIESDQNKIHLGQLKAGVYFWTIRDGENTSTGKFFFNP